MKCGQCRPLLAALAGGDLALGRNDGARLQAHLAGCPGCALKLGQLQGIVALLRRVGRSEPLPADFRASLRRRLAAEPPPAEPLSRRLWEMLERVHLGRGLRLGLGAAALAVVAVLLLSPLVLRRVGEGPFSAYGPEQEVAAAFRVPSQRVAVVHLDFIAEVALDEVEFEVSLPRELHFVDGGKPVEERTLHWRGSLALGRNPIPLAIRGVKPGRYRVTAQAHGPGVQVRHDILLEVVPS